jgi:phage terminase small subunit
MDLSPQQEKFAQAVAAGKTLSDAYRSAYNVRPTTLAKSVHEAASTLMANVKVASRIEEIRAPVIASARVTLEAHLDALGLLSERAAARGLYNTAIYAELARGRACGLYAKKAVTISTSAPTVDLSSLTDEELAEFQRLTIKATSSSKINPAM